LTAPSFFAAAPFPLVFRLTLSSRKSRRTAVSRRFSIDLNFLLFFKRRPARATASFDTIVPNNFKIENSGGIFQKKPLRTVKGRVIYTILFSDYVKLTNCAIWVK